MSVPTCRGTLHEFTRMRGDAPPHAAWGRHDVCVSHHRDTHVARDSRSLARSSSHTRGRLSPPPPTPPPPLLPPAATMTCLVHRSSFSHNFTPPPPPPPGAAFHRGGERKGNAHSSWKAHSGNTHSSWRLYEGGQLDTHHAKRRGCFQAVHDLTWHVLARSL